MEVLLDSHDIYNYDELFCELEINWKREDEHVNDFMLRVTQIYYIFHESDKLYRQEFLAWYSYTLYVPKKQYFLMHNEKYSSYQNYFSSKTLKQKV